MSILVDLSYINSDKKRKESVAIYAMRVLNGFYVQGITDLTLLVTENMSQFFKEQFPLFRYLIYPTYDSKLSNIPYIKGIYKMLVWKWFLQKQNFSIVYIPFAWSGNSLSIKAKKVITIHDLRPMREAESAFMNIKWFNLLGLKHIYFKCSRFFYGLHIKNATKIISISNYVKDDIITEWPNSNNKIETIYNGVVLSDKSICPNEELVTTRFILYVNTLAPYKNVKTLIQAYNSIKEEIKCKIVIVGKITDYWTNDVLPFIQKHHIEDRIHHITYCTDEELKWLYEHAVLFVTTSTKEGFGYTPVEAAICKCPVICTLSESLPEVTAGQLNYYDPPFAWEKLSILIESLLTNTIDRNKLEKLSRFFVSRYDNNSQSYKIYQVLTQML